MAKQESVSYEVFYDVEDGKTVIVIKGTKPMYDEVKKIANNHFKVSLNELCASYAVVTGDVVRYNENIVRSKANAIAVWRERG